jgi:hypothetical protein
VDSPLLEVASQTSEEIPETSEMAGALPPFGLTEAATMRALEALPRYEADAFLLRVARGEPLADVALVRRLSEVAGVHAAVGAAPCRSTAQLLAAAGQARRRSEGQRTQAAQVQRIAEMEGLAAREEQAWAMIDRLVVQRGARPRQAVDLLSNCASCILQGLFHLN